MGPEPGENPALYDLDTDLHLGLIPGLGRARRDDGKAIRLCEGRRGAIDLGFIAVRTDHGRLEVVGDDNRGDPTEGRKGPHLGAHPVRQTRGPGRLGIGVVRSPEDGHEKRHLVHLPTVAVDHGDALPSVLHTELLARTVGLPHDEIQLARRGAGGVTKPPILQAVGRGRFVFLPEQAQGDALPLQFLMDLRPIGHQVRRWGSGRGAWKQPPFQRGLILGGG